ncbi:hypothetical protein EWH79_14490, partial [Enterococcus faecium]
LFYMFWKIKKMLVSSTNIKKYRAKKRQKVPTQKNKSRLGQKCLTPRNKKKFTKIAFQIFVNFGLFKKKLLLLPPFIRF